MESADVGLLAFRQEGQERHEVAAAEEGHAEELDEGPEGGRGDEEEADGPEGVEVAEVRGGAGLEAEVDDAGEGEGGQEEEDGDEGEESEVYGRVEGGQRGHGGHLKVDGPAVGTARAHDERRLPPSLFLRVLSEILIAAEGYGMEGDGRARDEEAIKLGVHGIAWDWHLPEGMGIGKGRER